MENWLRSIFYFIFLPLVSETIMVLMEPWNTVRKTLAYNIFHYKFKQVVYRK